MGEFRKSAWPLVCDFTGLPSFLRHSVVDEVVIALPMHTFYGEASRVVALCEELGITTHCLSRLFDLKAARAGVELFDHESLITVQTGVMQGRALLVKRALDIAISLLCIILFAPVFLVVTLLVRFTSPGTIFFVQKRVGLSKRLITVHKFRTMVQDAEHKQRQLERFNEASGPVFKIKNDPRITPIGRFLRKKRVE